MSIANASTQQGSEYAPREAAGGLGAGLASATVDCTSVGFTGAVDAAWGTDSLVGDDACGLSAALGFSINLGR